MPWKEMSEVPDNLKSINDVPLKLEQANAIAAVADAIDPATVDSVWAVAIKQFQDTHEIKDGAWVKKESDNSDGEHALMKLSGLSVYAAREALRSAGLRKSGLSFVERDGDVYVYAKKADLKTVDIARVEAFRSGKWTDSSGKTTEYTDEDIADMAAQYNRLERQGCFEAPVKLGHDDAQPFKTDGYPAFGWLRNAVAEGGRLFFDLCGVPAKVADLIKAKGYKKRSMEIYHGYEDEETGRVIKHLPSGLALLGAMLPALGSLEEIHALYGNKLASSYSMDASGNDDTTNEKKKGSEYAMDEKDKKIEELMAKIAELEVKLSENSAAMDKMKSDHEAALKTEAGQTATFKAKVGEYDQKFKAIEDERKAEKVTAFKAKYGNRVEPAVMEAVFVPQFETILATGDNEKISAFTKTMDDLKVNPLLSEYAKENPDAKRGGSNYAEMEKKAAELCRADGKDFSTQANYSLYMKQAGWTIETVPEGESE